jgi:hypothetical protein
MPLMSPQERHLPDASYMELRQCELTVQMRSILVDWMAEVSLEYNLSNDTLFLAVRVPPARTCLPACA